MARGLSGLEVAVIMIDGLDVAGQSVVALAITTDGTKVPVGLWLGDTENKTVVTGLLADLAAQGLERRLLQGRRFWPCSRRSLNITKWSGAWRASD